jgi:hypothetical protein
MSYTVLNSKTVKIKKEQFCCGCDEKYSVGTEMMCSTVFYNDSDIHNNYFCLPCNVFLKDKWHELSDGIEPGECWNFNNYKEFRENFLKNKI